MQFLRYHILQQIASTMISNSMRSTLLVLVAATCFLALSGFECASTEMTTAKVAMGAKDYKKAEDNLRKEVAARPQNSEAWLILAQIYEEQRRYSDMNDAFAKAEAATLPPLNPTQKEAIVVKRYNLWLDLYNGGIKAYGEKDYNGALRMIDTAIMLRPDYSGNIYIKGLISSDAEQTDAQEKYFRQYIAMVGPDVERGIKLGLALGASQKEIEAKLGAPAEKKITDSTGGWAWYSAQSLAVYYTYNSKKGGVVLDGWRFLPPTASAMHRQLPTPLYSDPYYTLGVMAYQAGEKTPARYDEAIRLLQVVEGLDPALAKDRPIGVIIGQIYVTTGRTAEARSRFEESIRDNPNEPLIYINYGNLLINLKDYQGSVNQYAGAMRVSKESEVPYQQALFNTGAAYKNWGAVMQDSLRRAYGSKPIPKAQEESYLSKLRESVKAFERLRSIKGSGTDFALLSELANLYQVLGDVSKQKQIIGTLEAMESDNEKNAAYWNAMGNLYANLGESKKSMAAFAKYDALK